LTSTDDLLRELVALNREQNVYMQTMIDKISRLASKADIENAGRLMERESRSRRAEHKAILEKSGNGTKDKLLLLSFIVISTLAGASSAVALWLKFIGG